MFGGFVMTLNVNYKGSHIGFVARSFPENSHLFMIALTNLRIEEVELDLEKMKTYLAKVFGFTNFFGRVNEERFRNFIESKRQGKYEAKSIDNFEDFIRFIFMKVADERGYEIEKLFHWEDLKQHVDGYLLLDMENVIVKNGMIHIEEEIDYITEEKLPNSGVPIFATVCDYPIFQTDVMGVGEGLLFGANLSDFGGRNHAHATIIQLRSGNYYKEFQFPIPMNVKKGMPIQLYVKENEINRIFCNEAIYIFE